MLFRPPVFPGGSTPVIRHPAFSRTLRGGFGCWVSLPSVFFFFFCWGGGGGGGCFLGEKGAEKGGGGGWAGGGGWGVVRGGGCDWGRL